MVEDGVPDDATGHLVTLLDRAMLALRDAVAGVEAPDAPEEVRRLLATLRSSQLRLLSLVPAGGIRGTDLADRAGMTKQALSEFAQELGRRGLLDSVPDPSDGRARLWRHTDLGEVVARYSTAAIRQVEEEWRRAIGAERWDAMRQGLAAVGSRRTRS